MSVSADDFHALLRARRSRRFFKRDAIEPQKVERALMAAMRAPSGANAQPWEYVLIENGPIREQVGVHCERADQQFHQRAPAWLKEFLKHHEITPVKEFMQNAPLLVAVFGQRDMPFWLQSVWLSVANFITALETEGIHSLTYTPSLTKDFNKLLGVDESWSCQALLPIGYAEPEDLKPRPRMSPSEKVRIVSGQGNLKAFEATLPFEP